MTHDEYRMIASALNKVLLYTIIPMDKVAAYKALGSCITQLCETLGAYDATFSVDDFCTVAWDEKGDTSND